ncbi:colicin D domain-containing protein [Rhodococcus sp. IEGM 1330]|uniref:colicin D domain-containing protein n=1 Tax=Rhodococcus sp. IEGM 1330 TaxID=3082225 RepID=UPI002954C9AE|nr:colicin D domain-containing protein [Rhodococcus sp. IEGM 1330]MDV8023883.1 colicin D domain-containing protein [Rhodococcus sp. IEGM 1330]
MSDLDLDPQDYYDVADVCVRVAAEFFGAANQHLDLLYGCGSMAGSYEEATEWASSYDDRANETLDTIRLLAEAIHHYGDVVAQLGFNHAMADYNASVAAGQQSQLPPDPPPGQSAPMFVCKVPVPSAGGDGGLLDSGLGLVEKIGVIVPDGDTDKLEIARAAWAAIAADAACAAVPDALERAAATFDSVIAPDAVFVDEDLRELRDAADDVLNAANELAVSCEEHRDGLNQLRGDLMGELEGLRDDLLKELAITAAIGVAASFVTFGLGAIAASARAVSIAARFASPLRRVIDVWKSARNLRRGVGRERDLQRRQKELDRIKNLGDERPSPSSGPGLGPAIKRIDPVDVTFDAGQIEKKFKHAADFGVSEPRGSDGFRHFTERVREFMVDPKTEHISGTYRGDEVLLSVNPDTKLIVVQGPDGRFVTGWEMSEDQMASVLSEGRLY